MKEKVLERFLKYVTFDTTADPKNSNCPSSEGQRVFAKYIVEELKALGLEDANVDENSYVMATLKGNVEGVPTVGFISHLDTAPDVTGKNVKPRIVKNYDGKDIVLNEELNVVTSPKDYPEMETLIGEDVIVTDGTTLLGADDKAGIAEIVTAIEYLVNHPEIKHGDIKIGFTPDEEVGRGANLFDVEKFGAKYAYTMDGGIVGELQYENFNAAAATITIQGRNVHPGSAKNKLVNALHIAAEISEMFPANERPETTEGYEGFYHLNDINGNVEKASMVYIIRDHDKNKFEERKSFMKEVVEKVNEKYNGRITLDLNDQYYNMKEKVEPVKFVVDIVDEAMKETGITPIIVPIRGGTDGARLSFMGLPCPNIFTGGLNFHSKNECIPVSAMEKGAKLIVKIAEKYTNLK
ncbi:peptidase T [Paraclostridium sordellii]|uniref:Peptidase T n=1 Tax=Paraclostridium sordellii TaxID=1505 RepID=A0A0C7HYC5_PARSO|nr:peptidase T [Paeniclostridium sordellii]CEN79712.1 peptidase T [[Clostridium] sordellii] [Paeniclostridium sordellii]CEO05316.1 peptidase T [[Clostridium] sordellii] [Paeniclostridium sordellii]CEP85996.1 peptidase T [[Clostridium] sordellii] [Paeniclostridium sordellii]CEP96248.1 peptidase T [[Clostridium] sordellii] [Paeniclostridium sordellii]CEQ00285.1 peptidase T [[Clostridium] sordellii] [Paeniclostridium sordellii]